MGLGGASRHLQAALFLGLGCLALAQHQHGGGGEEGSQMDGIGGTDGAHDSHHAAGHHMAGPTSEDISLWESQSYWSLEKHAGLMYAHIAVMVIAWVVILPISKSCRARRNRPACVMHDHAD